jgi:hypothetical protein
LPGATLEKQYFRRRLVAGGRSVNIEHASDQKPAKAVALERELWGDSSQAEALALVKQAAKDASVCAEYGKPLTPIQSVTLRWRAFPRLDAGSGLSHLYAGGDEAKAVAVVGPGSSRVRRCSLEAVPVPCLLAAGAPCSGRLPAFSAFQSSK